jgi:ankyrin repeat protein
MANALPAVGTEELIAAVRAQDLPLVTAHLATLPPGAVDRPGRFNGSTALHWAVEGGSNVAVLEALLNAGADPLRQNALKDTPAHYAARHGRVAALACLHAHTPATLTAPGAAGEPPVFRAVFAPSPEAVGATLACIAALGGDLNARPAGEPAGCTPLIVAVRATKGASEAERAALAAVWEPVVAELLAQPSVDVRAAWAHHGKEESARDVAARNGQAGIEALLAAAHEGCLGSLARGTETRIF